MLVQLPVIYEMTKMLHNSALKDVPYSFDRIMHLEHYFCSSLFSNLASQYSTASDGIILTSSSLSESYVGTSITFASVYQPLRLGTEGYDAPKETLAFPKQRYPDLGVNLTDVELVFQHLNFSGPFHSPKAEEPFLERMHVSR